MIGAVLVGLDRKQNPNISSSLVSKVQSAFVEATNLALQESQADLESTGNQALAFVLGHVFGLLSDVHKRATRSDLLLPVLMEVVFSSNEGLQHGYWLGIIDRDIRQVDDTTFGWPASSSTFRNLQAMAGRPLLPSLGPLSRVIAYCIENAHAHASLALVVDRLAYFARILAVSWRQNKLSEVDATEDVNFLDQETRDVTLPLLWQVLRMSLYSTTILLNAVFGRVMADRTPSIRQMVPALCLNTLHILRNLYFVSSRLGETSSQQYTFVNLTAIDILSQYPSQAEAFINDIAPPHLGQIPSHPLDRNLDLFFLNTAEHLTLVLTSQTNENLVLAAAIPYLIVQENHALTVIFEAAHSATLSVLAAPQNGDIAARQIPFYTDTLLSCFPKVISSRQFRLAFRTLLRISSLPSPLAQTQPLLSAVLLDSVLQKAQNASQAILPQPAHESQDIPQPALSEQAILLMAVIDGLSFIEPALLQEWLPLTASALNHVPDPAMRQQCLDRFWEALSGGEMDVERAAVCHSWWSAQTGSPNPMPTSEALKSADLDQVDGRL